MSWRRRAMGGLLLAAWALVAVAPSGPGGAVDTVLRRARVIVVGGGERSDQLLSLHSLARELLDTRAMGYRAMGQELVSRPTAQQEEFHELFGLLMVRAYLQKLLLFRDPDFAIVAEDVASDAVVVRTKIFTTKDEFLVDYEMRRRDGHWRATDVVIEGISLTRNYRSQLHALLRSHDFEGLLDRMRRKTRTLAEPRPS